MGRALPFRNANQATVSACGVGAIHESEASSCRFIFGKVSSFGLFLGCTIRVLPGSAMRALSTFSPLFVSQGPYPPFSPICLTLGQFVNGGSAVKFRGTRGGTSAAKNVKNFTAETP